MDGQNGTGHVRRESGTESCEPSGNGNHFLWKGRRRSASCTLKALPLSLPAQRRGIMLRHLVRESSCRRQTVMDNERISIKVPQGWFPLYLFSQSRANFFFVFVCVYPLVASCSQLGATLANNRQSEDALPAYRRAIASKPGYARAWLNMGISQVSRGKSVRMMAPLTASDVPHGSRRTWWWRTSILEDGDPMRICSASVVRQLWSSMAFHRFVLSAATFVCLYKDYFIVCSHVPYFRNCLMLMFARRGISPSA